MDTDRLRLLVELERLGSMRAVADELATTTSTVSHQLSVLSRELGVTLIEPDGRGVRLTSAGRRVVARGRAILGAIEVMRSEAAGTAAPSGIVRVAGFATAIRKSLLPAVAAIATSHPDVRVVISEHEPGEARSLLASGGVDLALVFDYDLAPAPADPMFEAHSLWTSPWCLGVPSDQGRHLGTSVEIMRDLQSAEWIADSGNTFDERVLELLASMADYSLAITHRCGDLDLVAELISAGLGVGLLPEDFARSEGISLTPLTAPGVHMRAFALTRAGRGGWAPLSVLLARLQGRADMGDADRGPDEPA